MVVKVEPGDVGFAHEFGGDAGGGIGAEEQRCLLRTVHDGKAERIARLTPDHAGEIGEPGRVPIDPTRRAAGAGDDAKADRGVGGASSRVEEIHWRGFRVERIGDVAHLDGGFIGFLIGERLGIGRPPVPLGAIHFLLRDELGGRVGEGRGGAGGESATGDRREFNDVKFAGRDGGNRGAVTREARVNPVLSRERGDLEIGAVHDVELARESNEETRAVLGEIEARETLERDAFAFAAGLFLGAEFFLGGSEQLRGREQLALGTGRQREFVEPKDGIAGAAAEVDHRLAVGRELGRDRTAERIAARLGDVPEVFQVGVLIGRADQGDKRGEEKEHAGQFAHQRRQTDSRMRVERSS